MQVDATSGTQHHPPDIGLVQHLRDESFEALRAHLSMENLEGAMHCAAKMYAALPEKSDLAHNTVLVAYGGGKDSSYTLTFVRAIQLILSRVYGSTFRMRVVTNRHAGMPKAVMENIHRCYLALDLLQDPDCELLIIDGNSVQTFRVDLPRPDSLVRRNRDDILMTGHRTLGDARPTFCNACNLSMVNAFGLAAAHEGGVNMIVTGDSRREQRAYLLWVNRLAQRFGLDVTDRSERRGFKGFLKTMNNISQAYYQDIYGSGTMDAVHERRIETGVPHDLRFFSIYDDTDYASGDHWELLTGYLGFEFDDLAFSFTESDCANPALMAHLRGLKCERLFGRSYLEGIREYVQFAISLMHKKEFPEVLVDKVRARYAQEASVMRMREAMNAYAAEAFGMTEEQLVCMVYSPFAGSGQNLALYLQREQPALAGSAAAIHTLLRTGESPGAGGKATELRATLRRLSGLSLPQLQTLYARPLSSTVMPGERTDMLGAILERDPHKDVIETRHSPSGPVVRETLSGR